MTQQQIIAVTKQLVTIPTTADNLPGLVEATDIIQSLLASNEAITVERFESNGKPSLLAYVGHKRPARFDVLLNGHLDVVSGQPEQFIPIVKGNRFYGRGVYDMKMACVAMTDIFLRNAPDSPLAIGLQIVTDEEVGGYDCVSVQLKQGVRADFVIAGEMTDLGICNETRGVCWVEAQFKGTSAHSGYAWDGHNAVNQASDFAQKILQKFPLPAEKAWTTTANIAAIATNNTTFNQVPDSATVRIDFRFEPGDPHFKDNASVKKFLAEIDKDAHITAIPVFEQAVEVAPTNKHLATFIDAFSEVTGKKVELIRRYASSDARHFAMYGIPCIEFGLSGNNLHADQEYVDLRSLQPFCATLQKFMQIVAAQRQTSKKIYQLV